MISSRSIPGFRAPRYLKRFERFAADKRGLAAVEFAMIAVPFFFLIFGLLEVAMIFIMSTALEHAVNEASRQIRTGQAQGAAISKAAFKNEVCKELLDLLPCDTKLHIDVKRVDSFGGAAQPVPIDLAGEFDDSGFAFEMGAANEIVVVRAFYEWTLFVPIMSKPLENMSGGRRLLGATAVFRNEPFGG